MLHPERQRLEFTGLHYAWVAWYLINYSLSYRNFTLRWVLEYSMLSDSSFSSTNNAIILGYVRVQRHLTKPTIGIRSGILTAYRLCSVSPMCSLSHASMKTLSNISVAREIALGRPRNGDRAFIWSGLWMDGMTILFNLLEMQLLLITRYVVPQSSIRCYNPFNWILSTPSAMRSHPMWKSTCASMTYLRFYFYLVASLRFVVNRRLPYLYLPNCFLASSVFKLCWSVETL